MELLSFISSALKPVSDVIDAVHTSEEEKLKIKEEIFKVQAKLYSQTLQYEQKVLEAKTAVITAEANGQSWLQRSWRPITMLVFLALVVCDSFGWLENRLASEAWTLLQIGLGGYVVGRSAEKIAPAIKDMAKGRVDG